MDLRQYDVSLILHVVVICTRLPAATFIPNKRRDNHEEFFQLWVAVCGSPQKVLVENEGEFAIDDFSKNNKPLESMFQLQLQNPREATVLLKGTTRHLLQ